MKKSELKKYIKEALTPDEAVKVDSKYKEIYAGMLQDNPLKLKKYDNPDKVAYGRAIKLIQKESKMLNENEKKALEALRDSLLTAFNKYGVKTDHEIDPSSLRLDFIPNTPKDFESISRSLSKRFGQYGSKPFNVLGNDYTVSLDSNVNVSGPEKGMGKIMLTLDNAVNEKKLTAAEKAKKEDIIMALKKQKGGKDKLKPVDYAIATDRAKKLAETGEEIAKKNMDMYKDKNRLEELVKAALMGPISEKKKDHDGDGDVDSDDYMIARDKAIKKAMGKEVDESFDSLVKKVDKEKGYDKEDAKRVAGYIANRKREGAGKGPTAKMKKREDIKERILRELRK